MELKKVYLLFLVLLNLPLWAVLWALSLVQDSALQLKLVLKNVELLSALQPQVVPVCRSLNSP